MELEEIKDTIKYLEDLLETSEDEAEQKRLENIKKELEDKQHALEAIQLVAIGSHKTAVSKGPWDGPANTTKAKTDQDASYFAKIFAWRNSEGDPKKKTSYKFPHHEVSGDGTPGAANLKGCQAGIAALNGARGGTTIPATDKRGVWNHLASHIRDADATPAKLLEDMSEEEHAQYLQEIEEEVRKNMDKEKIQAYADEHKISFEEAEKKLKELEKEDAKKFEEEIKRLEEKAAEKEKDIDAKIAALEEKFAKEAEEKKQLEDKLKKLTDNDLALRKKLHEKDVEAKIKELETKGIYPAQLDIAKAIMLADSGTVKLFEEDPENEGQKKSVEKSIEEAVVSMLEALPDDARIDLSEKTRHDQDARDGKVTVMSFEEIQAEIKKHAEEHKISFDAAQEIVVPKLMAEGKYPLEDYIPPTDSEPKV